MPHKKELDRKYAIAYYNRGNAYFRKRDYDKAIADYDNAIKFDPKYASERDLEYAAIAYNNRGVVYSRKGDYDRAIADYDNAIKLDRKYAIAYNNRGIAYDEKGDYHQAIENLTEAIRVEDDHAATYLNRGGIYHAIGDSTGDYTKAIEDYDNAVRLCPNYRTDFIDGKFLLVYGKEAIEKAIELLDSMINNPPKSADDFYYIGVRDLFLEREPLRQEGFPDSLGVRARRSGEN